MSEVLALDFTCFPSFCHIHYAYHFIHRQECLIIKRHLIAMLATAQATARRDDSSTDYILNGEKVKVSICIRLTMHVVDLLVFMISLPNPKLGQ